MPVVKRVSLDQDFGSPGQLVAVIEFVVQFYAGTAPDGADRFRFEKSHFETFDGKRFPAGAAAAFPDLARTSAAVDRPAFRLVVIFLQPGSENLAELLQRGEFLGMAVVIIGRLVALAGTRSEVVGEHLVELLHHVTESPFDRFCPGVVCQGVQQPDSQLSED